MTPEIQTLIQACEWYPSSFLIFSENVFAPLIYYSHLGALIPTLLIGVYVFLSDRKGLPNKLLLYTNIAFATWIFGNLVLWANEYPSFIMTFWSLLILVEPFVYFFAFYFAYTFFFKKDLPVWGLILVTLPLYPTILLASTNLALTGFSLEDCDRVAYEGILAVYGYIVEGIYVLGIIVCGVWAIILNKNNDIEHKKISLTSFGLILFLVSFSLGNIAEVFTENWYIGLYGLFGAPVFVALLAYIIVRYRAFNLRLVGAQALVMTLWLLLLSLLFVNQIENIRVVIGVTLLVVTFVGISLIRSVKREIREKERNEVLAKDLAKANVRLRELDKLKSEFVSIASHQLRSPLTAIRGYASMLNEGSFGAIPEKAKEPIQRIEESSRFMALSVDDFLNVSRIESGSMKYEKAIFSLSNLASVISDNLRPAAIKKGLVLVYRSDADGDMHVNADEGKVRQIIQNVIDNAMKYTPKGTITVVAQEDAKAKKARVLVVDTGVGMSEETATNLFGKFVRAKNANSVNVYGTGLGLYIAKQMIEAMGGSLTAKSDGEGKGSTFTIELPLEV